MAGSKVCVQGEPCSCVCFLVSGKAVMVRDRVRPRRQLQKQPTRKERNDDAASPPSSPATPTTPASWDPPAALGPLLRVRQLSRPPSLRSLFRAPVAQASTEGSDDADTADDVDAQVMRRLSSADRTLERKPVVVATLTPYHDHPPAHQPGPD